METQAAVASPHYNRPTKELTKQLSSRGESQRRTPVQQSNIPKDIKLFFKEIDDPVHQKEPQPDHIIDDNGDRYSVSTLLGKVRLY